MRAPFPWLQSIHACEKNCTDLVMPYTFLLFVSKSTSLSTVLYVCTQSSYVMFFLSLPLRRPCLRQAEQVVCGSWVACGGRRAKTGGAPCTHPPRGSKHGALCRASTQPAQHNGVARVWDTIYAGDGRWTVCSTSDSAHHACNLQCTLGIDRWRWNQQRGSWRKS